MIVVKEVKPSRLKEDAFRLAALNRMRKVATGIKKDYDKITATWKGDKPTWGEAVSLQAPGPTLAVEPAGETGPKGVKKFGWLDRGTRVRYATMSRDFKAKTAKRFIGSQPGQGGAVRVSKLHPQPGIEAREFTPELEKIWTPKFKREMEEAMREGRDKCGHKM